MHAAQAADPSGMAEIINDGREVEAFGRKIRVRRLTLGMAARVLPHIYPLKYIIGQLLKYPADERGRPVVSSAEMLDIIADGGVILAGSGEDGEHGPLVKLFAVLTEMPEEWVADQDPLDAAELLVEVVEANASFFSPASRRRVAGLRERLSRTIPQLGGSQSNGSSTRGTEPKTTSFGTTPSNNSTTSSPASSGASGETVLTESSAPA